MIIVSFVFFYPINKTNKIKLYYNKLQFVKETEINTV